MLTRPPRGTGTAQHLLRDLDDDAQTRALAVLHDALRERETPDGVVFNSATWFITARQP